jgi:hypothetical protein
LKKFYVPRIAKLYSTILSGLNGYAFQGQGRGTFLKDGRLQLYKTNSNQIIYFELDSFDNLMIEWRLKYYQQEMVFKDILFRTTLDWIDNIAKVRANSPEEIANYKRKELEAEVVLIIERFNEKYKKHKEDVDSKGIPERILGRVGISAEQLRHAREFFDY